MATLMQCHFQFPLSSIEGIVVGIGGGGGGGDTTTGCNVQGSRREGVGRGKRLELDTINIFNAELVVDTYIIESIQVFGVFSGATHHRRRHRPKLHERGSDAELRVAFWLKWKLSDQNCKMKHRRECG